MCVHEKGVKPQSPEHIALKNAIILLGKNFIGKKSL